MLPFYVLLSSFFVFETKNAFFKTERQKKINRANKYTDLLRDYANNFAGEDIIITIKMACIGNAMSEIK